MTNEAFQALLARGPVLLDGATGSNLMRAGMPRGICTEVWVTEHPEPLLALQRDYIAAGSQIIYAPTFCANRRGLARCGRENLLTLLDIDADRGDQRGIFAQYGLFHIVLLVNNKWNLSLF